MSVGTCSRASLCSWFIGLETNKDRSCFFVGVFSNIGGDTCTRIGGNGGMSSTETEKKSTSDQSRNV